MERLYRTSLLLFFFSGLTGLVYEILWTRRLSLTFGHSLLAVSTVVTAYMGGLALGSLLGGRWGDRQLLAGAPGGLFLKAYGRLELAIGIWGLLSLPLLGAVETLYFSLAARGGQGLSLHIAVFFLSLLVLLPPTTAMGATLPLLSCLFHASPDSLGVKLSRLYASNTWGAVLGSGLAGFILLPVMGLTASVGLAALLNLAVGIMALRTRGAASVLALPPPPPVRSASLGLPLVFAVSGFASMLFQLGWTRGLALFLGSSVYSFSAILLAFLAGIALGSGLYSAAMRGREPRLNLLGWLYAALGLSGALSIPLMSLLPDAFLGAFRLVGAHFPLLLSVDVLLCAAVVLLPTLLFGLLFPMVTHLYHQRHGSLGGSVGAIYGANTLGCIGGSFLGGFFAMPELGVQATLQLAATLCLACALLVGNLRVRGLALLGLAACWGLPAWDTGLASAGVAISVARERQAYYPPPAFYKDGLSCSVALAIHGPGDISLIVNGKPDASLTPSDRLTQTSLGLIPLLYQPKPGRVAVVGLGGGVTVTAVAGSPRVQKVECAELEPAVIECQRFWGPYNQHILRNPKVDVRVADGRTFILSSPRPYDVIISEPSNPWIAGIGNLYTLDFYQACRDRLSPGGCFVQWCNLYALSPEDLNLVVRTFFSAFPHGDLWTTGGDLVLVGSAQPTRCSPEPLREYALSNAWLTNELGELGYASADELVAEFLCSRERALAALPTGALNRDDLPRLEYSAPRSLYRPDALRANLQRVLSWRDQDLPEGWPQEPEQRLACWIGRLNFIHPDQVRFDLNRLPVAGWRAFFEVMNSATPGDPIPHRALAGNWPARANLELARRAGLQGDHDSVLRLAPKPHRLRAEALYRLGRWPEALAEFAVLPPSSEVVASIASCLYFSGQMDQAASAAEQTLQLNPYDCRALFVKADLARRRGDRQTALATVSELTRLCPEFVNGWHLHLQLLQEMGQADQRRRLARQALRMFPGDPVVKAALP